MLNAIKWIACAFLFYFIYDVVRKVDKANLPVRNRVSPPAVHPSNITGATGTGMMVAVDDGSGIHRRQKVGRGVVSRS